MVLPLSILPIERPALRDLVMPMDTAASLFKQEKYSTHSIASSRMLWIHSIDSNHEACSCMRISSHCQACSEDSYDKA